MSKSKNLLDILQFNKLSPNGKKYAVWSVIGIVLLVFILFAYHGRKQKKIQTNPVAVQQVEGPRLNPDLMDKTALAEQRRQMELMQKETIQLKNELGSLKTQLGLQEAKTTKAEQDAVSKTRPASPDSKPLVPKVPGSDPVSSEKQDQAPQPQPQGPVSPGTPTNADNLPNIPTADEIINGQKISVPVDSPYGRDLARQQRGAERGQRGGGASNGHDETKQYRGGISVLTNENAPAQQQEAEATRKVYLPPSFMEAMLLTGFDASTSNDGKGEPEPLLLRIQTPAWLPNDIKANLAGCFVIGEARGRLDKERADVRAVTLACLSKSGDAVIDEAITGFVTDSDAKVGISGHVVSKMGAALARTFMAGMMEGAGDAIRDSATTTSTSALGTTSTIDSSQVGKAALGSGLADTADKLSDFYLNLAKQSTPVIEVQAEKRLTVVISEGKWLEVKPLKHTEQAGNNTQQRGRKTTSNSAQRKKS